MDIADQPKIRVVIRKRPINKKQLGKSEQDVVEVEHGVQVKVRQHKLKVDLTKYIEEHMFNFDSAFGDETTNQKMYEDCVKPLVQCAFLGAKVTCFAYGQTGSGKTYTMNGDIENGCPGMYYLGAQDIFTLRDQSYQNLGISVSFYQIYCGKLFDLLNNREQLQAREDGKQNVNIVGLTVKQIYNIQEFMDTIICGSAVRITSQNSTNSDSSRSHAILQISLMNGKKPYGKISFIDLAGCQRGADTLDQNKQTKIDGAEINKSLLALKECIRALDQGKNHTPFRGSKLTMVLKDSFIGFCRTLMIGNISPSSGSCQNTLNTLRYADRVKQLKKSSGQQNREDQMSRQLMLPRSQKNKQIIMKKQSDSQEQIVITPNIEKQKVKNSRAQKQQTQSRPTLVNDKKKPRYIQSRTENVQAKCEELNDEMMKRRQNPANKIKRQGIMGIGAKPSLPNENTYTKSVNHFAGEHQKIHRNKSVIGKDIKNIEFGKGATPYLSKKNQSGNQTQTVQRKSCAQNHSIPYIKEKTIPHIQHKLPTQKSEDNFLESGDYQEWEALLQKFRKWKPNTYEFEEMSGYFEELVRLIMKEELEISEAHKALLKKQEVYLAESINLYKQSQREHKNNDQMFQYTSRLNNHFSSRVKLLTELNQKIETYQYHLREHEICEKKLIEAGEMSANSGRLWNDEYQVRVPNIHF